MADAIAYRLPSQSTLEWDEWHRDGHRKAVEMKFLGFMPVNASLTSRRLLLAVDRPVAEAADEAPPA